MLEWDMARTLNASLRNAPIDLRGARSGYVYVAKSPDNSHVCKIGRTTRPPHVRIGEIGKTTWLEPLEVQTARFFWDAIGAERSLHLYLANFRKEFTTEWFSVPAGQVAPIVRDWQDPLPPKTRKVRPWEDGEWMKMRMEWAVEDIASTDPKVVAASWREIEKLSALGHSPASWMLAEKWLIEDAPAERVLWVLDAASRQGHPGASLRRNWMASMTAEDPARRRWKESVAEFLEQKPDPSLWSREDRETLEREVQMWDRRPSTAWCAELRHILR